MTRQAVVLGGGAGGLSAANRLARIAAGLDLEVVLVDRSAESVYAPGFVPACFVEADPAAFRRPLREVLDPAGRPTRDDRSCRRCASWTPAPSCTVMSPAPRRCGAGRLHGDGLAAVPPPGSAGVRRGVVRHQGAWGDRMTVHHPVFARLYARLAPAMERSGAGEHRRRLLADVSGRVVEVGAGTGANFAHFPTSVTEVVAVEPEAYLRARAEAAEHARVPVTVVDGVADRLPAGDGTFDAAVVTLVLCSVPDQAGALREIHRVLRPGGRLHFWEHVRADGGALARVQRVLDRTVWPTLGGGCHASRDTLAAVEGAGFRVDRVDRFRFPDAKPPMPTAPQVLGTAVRV